MSANKATIIDGYALISNNSGIYLSDDRVDEILAELIRRAAVVFVHLLNIVLCACVRGGYPRPRRAR
jgi:hypothetical protein